MSGPECERQWTGCLYEYRTVAVGKLRNVQLPLTLMLDALDRDEQGDGR